MITMLTPFGKIELQGNSFKYELLTFYLELVIMKPELKDNFNWTINNCIDSLKQ